MDKSKLTRGGAGPAGLPTDTVDITVNGEELTVQVRALNRGELLISGKIGDDGQAAMERYILSCALLDPEMSLEDVADWQASGAAMECQPVLNKINVLSGVSKGSAKSDVPGDGERPVD